MNGALKKTQIMQMCKDGKSKRNRRLSGCGKKVQYSKEEIIAQRILRLQEMHLCVMLKDIHVGKIAKEEIRNPLFRASPGWISRFMHRCGLLHG